MRAWGIILAAGTGSRLAEATGGTAKQFVIWNGLPLFWHSARTFARVARMAGLVFVFPPDDLDEASDRVRNLDACVPLGLPWKAVAGGPLRQDSVRNGLNALPSDPENNDAGMVLIHDAARPFASPALLNRVLDALASDKPGEEPGVIPGLPVTDTIKIVVDGHVASTPGRSTLRAVQTPQGFAVPVLRKAHERAVAEGWEVTDDAALLERCGIPVLVVEGEPGNIKITTPEDLAMLQPAAPSPPPRTGFGYDVHRYVPEGTPKARPMRLGGVAIPGAPCVQAHSDGDVLLHALADALLACCAEGDIGRLFPDTDAACEGINSAVIVDAALERVLACGLRLSFADLTIIAQTPKVAPHWMPIRANVARLLRMDVARVSLKATTEEGLGFTGNKEGVKAVAVITALETLRQTGE